MSTCVCDFGYKCPVHDAPASAEEVITQVLQHEGVITVIDLTRKVTQYSYATVITTFENMVNAGQAVKFTIKCSDSLIDVAAMKGAMLVL